MTDSGGEERPELIENERWPALPDAIQIAAGIDLDADDPAHVDEQFHGGRHTGARRRCVSVRLDGERCASRAMNGFLLCPLHEGRNDPRKAAHALHTRRREAKRHAESVLQLQRLGTRAVVAEALVAEAANVDKAVRLLCTAAGNGDLNAAKALIPWLNQALGMPTERVEHRLPGGLEELEQLEEAELERLVARGRERRRLQLVESAVPASVPADADS